MGGYVDKRTNSALNYNNMHCSSSQQKRNSDSMFMGHPTGTNIVLVHQIHSKYSTFTDKLVRVYWLGK
ncbi:hypothetical protein BDF14DRAFT_1774218 [Spinellus fusiger]|nr:hypothetical protein BDF14DRAFT_1774218 [Spinellus fusiger]